MAKLALINSVSVKGKESVCAVGDIVGIFPDSHKFTDYEKNVCFKIVTIAGTPQQVDVLINAKHPAGSDDETKVRAFNYPKYRAKITDNTKPATSIATKITLTGM